MKVLGKKITSLTYEDIKILIDDKIAESKTLDYKEVFDVTDDKKKEEFLKDVSAFYNTEGGTIIFGLSERREGKRKLGIPILPESDKLTIDDYEKEKSRISHIVLSGTNPKIVNLQFSDLLDIDGCRVFAIGIPKNISIPAMVIYNGSNTFHKRNYTDKYMPDTHELFRAFLSHHSLKEEVTSFIKNRLKEIYEPFSEGLRNLPVVITHIVPSNFQEIITLDSFGTKEFKEFVSETFPPIGFGQKQQYGYSFEGLFLLQKDDANNPHYTFRDKQRGHTLLFRNGCIETINNIFFSEIEEGSKYCMIYVRQLAEYLNNIVNNAFLYYQKLNFSPDFYISISLYNLLESTSLSDNHIVGHLKYPSLTLPIIHTSEIDQKKEVLGLLFDILWQSAGKSQCPEEFKNTCFRPC